MESEQPDIFSDCHPDKDVPFLSVIIPAYNEEKRIEKTLERVIAFLTGRDFLWEIVLVDDGSDDDMVSIVRRISSNVPLRIVQNETNMGKGASVKKGMIEARGRVRLFTDADLSTPIEDLDKLLAALNEGADVAIASRALEDSILEQRQRWYRELMGRIFNLLVRILFLREIHDTQCGFKLFSGEAAEKVFPLQTLSGFAFDVETLVLARRFGYTIAEVPVKWINSPASKVHVVKDAMRMFLDLLRLKFSRNLKAR